MKWDEVFCHTYKLLRKQIEPTVKKQVDFMLPSMPMVDACRADDFDFFHPLIEAGKLTTGQMRHAAERYHLGKTKSGQPIFWMIDDMLTPLDAHILPNTWMSSLLKKREHLFECWQVQHCLFGLHLLMFDGRWKMEDGVNHAPLTVNHAPLTVNHNLPIAIVESELSAVVLSELFPECIWMAYATTPHLSPDLFAPLEGRIVTLYPRTDPTLSTFLFFEDLADITRRQYDIDMTVDSILEDHATADQKDRCIDILDFILESLNK